MTYATAKKRVVTIIEETTPVAAGNALGTKFVHDVKGSEEKTGAPGRRFWLRVIDGGSVAPSSSFSTRRRCTLALVVEYPALIAQTSDGDDAMVGDYDAISAALLDGTKWARATSSIVAISADGQELALPYVAERATTGWRMRLTFTMEYEA
jgi:hypothetical protein